VLVSALVSDTVIGTMVTSICPLEDTAITMTIAAKKSRRPTEVSNSVQIWEALGAKL
jgi:hypothetical protein